MKNAQSFISQITFKEVIYFVLAFSLVFLSAKFGQYIFFGWRTSPAVLWPPTGLGLAIIWLGGYRYAVPIFLALFAASITGPTAHLIPAIITTPFAQVLGQVTGVYLLRKLGFEGSFATVRNVLKFLVIVVLVCMIAPSITTLISLLTGNLTTALYISWSRAWAGYIFSCLILTPLILAWAKPERHHAAVTIWETSVVGGLLMISVYCLFWIHNAAELTFLFFALFFISHFWVSFRFSTRLVTLSMFFTTVFGIVGLFLIPNPEHPLNSQLLSTELFLFLVVPIFYAFSALVKERTNTISDLKVAMSRIERESTVQSNFISVLAHELRNPLSPVKTTLEILSELDLGDEIHELIQSANYQVHSMRRLLDDLLDISRVTQGKFQLQIERAHLCTMVDRSLELTKSLYNYDHTFVIPQVCDDSIWLNVDPVRFEQALVNVLNNASKYTESGGLIELLFAVKGNVIEIRIRDNGIGIEPEFLDHIFEPFWQVRNNATSSGSGIGVGLSITKYIIELHGGHIRAESEGRGKGSTFIITMPLATKSTPMSNVTEKDRSGIPSYKILIVDDNHPAADSLKKLLTLKGHTAQTAYSGLSAIEAAEAFEPELILLDIGLPDISGYDVARSLRAKGFQNEIIALSGYGQKEDKENARKAGCNHHFTKPMGIATLDEYLMHMHKV